MESTGERGTFAFSITYIQIHVYIIPRLFFPSTSREKGRSCSRADEFIDSEFFADRNITRVAILQEEPRLNFILMKINEAIELLDFPPSKDWRKRCCVFISAALVARRKETSPPVLSAIYFERRISRFLQVERVRCRQHVAGNAILRNYVSETLHQRGHCNLIRDRTSVTDHVLLLKDDHMLVNVNARVYLSLYTMH